MDKNTITGLVLMALVFFGFMWLSPKQSAEESRKEASSAASEVEKNSSAVLEPLTSTEIGWLRKNISEQGTQEESGAVSLNQNGVNLTLKGDSISGYVAVGGKEIPWTSLASGSSEEYPASLLAQATEKVRELSTSIGRYGSFSSFTQGTDSVVKLENDAIALQFSTKGGVPTRAELKKYDTEYNADETVKSKRKVVIFDTENGSLNFRIPLAESIDSKNLYFTPKVESDSTVLMALNLPGGAYWGLRYTLPRGENYVLKIDVVQKDMARTVESNNRTLGIDWTQQIMRQEKGRMFEERNSGIFYKFAGGSVDNLNENKNDKEERQSKVRWVAFKNQFFSSVLVAHRAFTNVDMESKVIKNSDFLKDCKAEISLNDYDWSAANPATFSLYIGPNLYPLLSSLDDKIDAGEDLSLTRLIPLGWSLFRWINTGIIIPIFTLLGSFISNYGIIILILTIFIKLILFPLTYKSYKSQAKMRLLAPDIKAINDKYPGQDNALKRQQKTMELYSRAGASPMSGCLPMLLQMPILFAMFSFFPSCIELRGQKFLWADDLAAPDAIISWSGNIPLVTEYFGNHISLFCLLMTVTNIIYTYINMQNQQNSMPGMKWMMYLMPVFFMVFFNNYAAGLSYYYFLSLLITIIQTYAVRGSIKEESVRKAMAEAAKKPKKKSGFMARLEEMQKQQQQMLKEQQRQRGGSKK